MCSISNEIYNTTKLQGVRIIFEHTVIMRIYKMKQKYFVVSVVQYN